MYNIIKNLLALAQPFYAVDPAPAPAPADPAPAPAPADPAPAPNPAPADPNPAPAPADPGKNPPADPNPAPADPGKNPPADPKTYWPQDWREQYAKGDEKVLARLKRFDSPAAAIDSFFDAQKKISSGQLKSSLSDKATPEEIAAWREENGIPAESSGYMDHIKLPDGLVIGDEDKPIVAEFLNKAHGQNMTPAQVNEAVSWYYDTQDKIAMQRQIMDKEFHDASVDELRKEWGDEYRRNVGAIKNLIESAPGDVGKNIMGARLADGTALGDNPQVLRWLTNLALEINPAATVVPGSGTNSMSNIESEIKTIEDRMAKDRTGYFKDEKMQARYRDLITARDKLTAKG